MRIYCSDWLQQNRSNLSVLSLSVQGIFLSLKDVGVAERR